jgi:hypothetical protein
MSRVSLVGIEHAFLDGVWYPVIVFASVTAVAMQFGDRISTKATSVGTHLFWSSDHVLGIPLWWHAYGSRIPSDMIIGARRVLLLGCFLTLRALVESKNNGRFAKEGLNTLSSHETSDTPLRHHRWCQSDLKADALIVCSNVFRKYLETRTYNMDGVISTLLTLVVGASVQRWWPHRVPDQEYEENSDGWSTIPVALFRWSSVSCL